MAYVVTCEDKKVSDDGSDRSKGAMHLVPYLQKAPQNVIDYINNNFRDTNFS